MAQRLICTVVPDDVLGDLAESWRRIAAVRGASRARLWYWRQALAWRIRVRSLHRVTTPVSPRPKAALMHAILEDLRHSLRSLRRAPAFSLTCVAVLALGLGASTTIFSLVNWVLLRPVPGVAEPDGLVTVRLEDETGAVFFKPHPLVDALRDRVEAFSSLAAYFGTDAHFAVSGRVAARPVKLEVVTANYFDVLGMSMAAGRGFTGEEAAGGGDPFVAVISWRLWRDALGLDPGALGRDIVINGRPLRLVGVASRGFLGAELPGSTDVWAPVAAHQVVRPEYEDDFLGSWRAGVWFTLMGRLRAGDRIETAAAQLAAAEASLAEQMPLLRRFDLVATPGVGMMRGELRRLEQFAMVLGAAMGFLLLITCSNFGNLLLAYGRRRRREFAVRAAVGAGRARLVRQQLCVSTLLALAGGALGLAAAAWAVGLFGGGSNSGLEGWRAHSRILTFVEIGEVRLDARVALFSLAAALLTGTLFGVLPALAVTRERADLMAPARGAEAGVRRLREALMVLQLAVSFALVAGSALMAQTIGNLRAVDLGLRPDSVFVFELQPGIQGYEGEALSGFFPRLLERLSGLPGVDSVSSSVVQPFGRWRSGAYLLPEGVTESEAAVAAGFNSVSPGFFSTLGVRVLAGRTFDSSDEQEGAPPVAVVSRRLAERLYPDGSALGRVVSFRWEPDKARTIVGIIDDIRLGEVGDEVELWFFAPIQRQHAVEGPAVFGTDQSVRGAVQVRSQRAAGDLIPDLRATVAEVDPTLPLLEVGTLRGMIEQHFAQPALLSRISLLLAALALLLAGTGLYGVLSAMVSERRHELGVRTALGATGTQVVRLVLRGGLGTALLGSLLGMLLALGLGRLLASLLFHVPSADPLSMLGAAAVLLGVTLVASALPARRAGRLDPVEVLRQE